MEGLTYYQPENAFGPIQVVEPASRSGGQKNSPLNLNKEAVHNMSLPCAFREVLQNFIDAIVQLNGESFVGLSIKRCMRRSQNVILFYNEAYILGEIVHDGKKVSFVNMAPSISTVNQITQFGASKKRGIANQAGQHGSGLKYAALKFLMSGYKMDIFFAIEEDQQTEFRHLIFKVSDREECLAYTLTSLNPVERFKGAADFHRFELSVRSGEEIPQFHLDDYMISDPVNVRGQRDKFDHGSVILDPEEKRRIYVWNFYVNSYNCVLYAYNLFLPNITHDRDQVDMGVLTSAVASVWSETICTDAEKAKVFYQEFLMNPNVPDCVEKWAIGDLSVPAANVLYALFKAEYRAYPISKTQLHLISPQHNSALFHVTTEHALRAFGLILTKLESRLDYAQMSFCKCASVPLVCPVLMPSLTKYFSKVHVVLADSCTDQMVYYAVQHGELYLCQAYIGVDGIPLSIEELCDILFFFYKVFPTGFKGTTLMEDILWRKKTFNLAKNGPLLKEIVIPIDDDSDYVPEEDEIPWIQKGKKRDRKGKEEEEEGVLPNGYQYYSGPPLLVKIQ